MTVAVDMRAASLLARGDMMRGAMRIRSYGERSHVDEILARFDEVDAQLVKAGFPPTSPWWRATIERWYRSGKRQLVARVGRRGGKSSSLSRLAVVEMLYGQHEVPPGDTGVVAVVSIDRSEAAARLVTITAILDALGVPHMPWGDGAIGIKLVDRPLGARVYTASIKGVSGFTAIFVFCDEAAKWNDNATGVNPATEVLSSIRPTMRTQKNARIALSSSPFGMLDAHYDAFEEGETDYQVTAHAPTWVANPTVTEEETRRDERDESKWRREYGAIPQAEVESSLLTEALIDRATRTEPLVLPREEGHFYVAAMDPATRGHAWTLVLATRAPEGKRRVVLACEWSGTQSAPLRPGEVFAEMRRILAPYGVTTIVTDQFALDPLTELARQHGLYLRGEPWTQQNKVEAFEEISTLLEAETLELPPIKHVKTDLLGIRKKLTRSGVVYQLVEQNGRHSDFAPALALAVMGARARAKVPPSEVSVAEQAEADKRRFLEERMRDRKQRERMGRPPPTHRRRAA